MTDAITDRCDGCEAEGFRTRYCPDHSANFCDGCWERIGCPHFEHDPGDPICTEHDPHRTYTRILHECRACRLPQPTTRFAGEPS